MNIARDYANNVGLKLAGWRLIRVWECEIRSKARREETLNLLYASITQSSNIGHYPSNEIDNRSIAAEPYMPYGDWTALLYRKDTNVVVCVICEAQTVRMLTTMLTLPDN